MLLKSLQWRLVSIFILLTVFLIIPIGLFLNKRVEGSYYQSFKQGIDIGFDGWIIGTNNSLNEMVKYLDEDRNAITQFYIIGEFKSYTVINRNDVNDIKFSSDRVFSKNRNQFENEILASDNLLVVMAGQKKGDKSGLVRTSNSSFFDYARHITLSDGEYVLYFRYDSEDWRDITGNFNNIIVTSLLISIIISLALGYVLSKTITVPINNIMHKARDLAAGKFEQVLEVKSDDEIGKLTESFNYMAKNLKDTLVEISSEKNKVETILNYMTDGVIAFNIRGKVIHSNPASREMLNEDDFSETFNYYAEKYCFKITLEEILYNKTQGNNEINININNKSIKVYFAVFSDEQKNPEGIIAVFQDITEQQKLENMRKEFVANVSHELRTPLTSIKSYTETLLDGVLEDIETSQRFLNVINSEADRMTRLVRDLLQLSRMDNKQMQWNKKSVSIVELVSNCIEKMKIEADNKKLVFKCIINEDIPEIIVDYDRIERVVLNVFSNAIKYTPSGGEIIAYISKIQNEVQLKVSDTGIGIPKEDLPRIFERFYRVDKARSREMGGTGLGLSIAKEIIEAHYGSISIVSEPDKGTDVIVKLPILVLRPISSHRIL